MSLSIDSEENPHWRLCSTENDWHEVENLIGFSTSEEPPNVAELETFLKCPPKGQTLVKLLTINQMTVGVYIVRLKGVQEEGGLPLHMPVLDGVFIKKAYRRQGWATKMIEEILQLFPGQDVGFSQPISNSLTLVVRKFLSSNPQYRDKLWAVENGGGEGDRFNLWLMLAVKK